MTCPPHPVALWDRLLTCGDRWAWDAIMDGMCFDHVSSQASNNTKSNPIKPDTVTFCSCCLLQSPCNFARKTPLQKNIFSFITSEVNVKNYNHMDFWLHCTAVVWLWLHTWIIIIHGVHWHAPTGSRWGFWDTLIPSLNRASELKNKASG